jgi:tyrosyl-tRNA synthetase
MILGKIGWDENGYSVAECIEAWENRRSATDPEFYRKMCGFMATFVIDEPGSLAQMMVDGGLADSLGDARRAVKGGGVTINDRKVADPMLVVGRQDASDGWLMLGRGKDKRILFLLEAR